MRSGNANFPLPLFYAYIPVFENASCSPLHPHSTPQCANLAHNKTRRWIHVQLPDSSSNELDNSVSNAPRPAARRPARRHQHRHHAAGCRVPAPRQRRTSAGLVLAPCGASTAHVRIQNRLRNWSLIRPWGVELRCANGTCGGAWEAVFRRWQGAVSNRLPILYPESFPNCACSADSHYLFIARRCDLTQI